jgi:hypothetical protein
MLPPNENVTGGIMPKKRMGINQRYDYLAIQYDRYIVADSQERGRLLDEMEAVTELDRKHLIRLMRTRPRRKPRRKQRGRKYGAAVQDAIHLIARALDYPCAERLQPMLPAMLDQLAQHGHLEATPELHQQLETVSVSTVRRIRQRREQDEPRLRRRRSASTTNEVQAQIPIRRIPWDIDEPGHFEVDLVHHGGPSASGEFICTLQMVDVYSGWVEPAAILGRSFRVTRDGFLRCLARLPFPALEIHSDNGPEFMNHHLLDFWGTHYPAVDLSRIRPYQKEDNRFVEHRNGALIRALLGRDRLDTVEQTMQLNYLYERVWLYHNLFQPVMRQTEKIYAQGRTRRKHEDVRTPCQRICAAGVLSDDKQRELTELFQATDPLALREEIQCLISQLCQLPGAEPGHTEDIFDTLAFPDIA